MPMVGKFSSRERIHAYRCDGPVAAQQRRARALWKSILDYQFALEAIERYHADFYLLRDEAARERSLLATYGAHVARYRFALDFIERAENDRELSKVLNEPVPELGLKKGAYDRFKFHNGLARQFDAEYGTPGLQWDMVLFLDGAERQKRAAESDVVAFRASWQRPKLHVLLPENSLAKAEIKP